MAGTLRLGSRGPDVVTLQNQLNQIQPALFPPLTPDGAFGPKTREAVQIFQGKKNLDPDGIVGPKTQAALDSATSGGSATTQPEFVGFTDDQIATLQADIARAKTFLDTTLDNLALTPFLNRTPPDIKAIALRNIFHIDTTLDPMSTQSQANAAMDGVNMLILTRSVQAVRRSLDQQFSKVFHPPGSAPPSPNAGFFAAWVDTATFDPTMHISHRYFDPNFVPDGPDRSRTFIHERAHTILKLAGHPGTGDGGFPDGKPHNGSHLIQDFNTAQRNAYAYEWLVECFQRDYNPAGA